MIFLLLACSFTTYEYTPCSTDGQCRGAFGAGMVCGTEGFCEALPAEPRCQAAWPEDYLSNPEDHKNDLLMGTIFNRDAVEGDLEEALAAELAIRQVNDEGGLDGRNYAILHCDYFESASVDSRTATEAIQDVTRYLGRMGAPVIVGPATSSMSQDAYITANELGIMLISPSATSPALTDMDGLQKSDASPGLFWRTAPPDDLQGLVIAQDMVSRQSDRVAVIYETSTYGSALAETFVGYFQAGDRTAELFPFAEADDTERNTQVTTVGGQTFDEVLFISGNINDYIGFLNAAAQLSGYTEVPIFFTDGGRDVKLLENTPDARNLYPWIRGSAPAVPTGDLYDFFTSAYSATFSPYSAADSSYTSYAYDAAWLGIYGTVWSQNRESDDCKATFGDEDGICGLGAARGMRKVSEGASVDIKATSWNTIKASFEAGQTVDVEGASGHLDYNPTTGETVGPVDIWGVLDTNDGFYTIETITP